MEWWKSLKIVVEKTLQSISSWPQSSFLVLSSSPCAGTPPGRGGRPLHGWVSRCALSMAGLSLSGYMEHMYNVLFILGHLGCLFLLLRERSAGNQRRITRTAQEKGDFRVNLLCCVWPSQQYPKIRVIIPSWTTVCFCAYKILEWIGFVVFVVLCPGSPARTAAAGPGLCRQPGEGRQQFLLSSLAASFSISQWFEGTEDLLRGREGGVVKSAFLAFCLFNSRVQRFSQLSHPFAHWASGRCQLRGFEHCAASIR